jgi:hypothetical protein
VLLMSRVSRPTRHKISLGFSQTVARWAGCSVVEIRKGKRNTCGRYVFYPGPWLHIYLPENVLGHLVGTGCHMGWCSSESSIEISSRRIVPVLIMVQLSPVVEGG